MRTRFLSTAALLASCACVSPPSPLAQTVILVSLDGFRSDYLELANTPNLDRLAATGMRAEALIPVFPANTFPNHYTIATGLYPEHHGIVDNVFYDPTHNEVFSMFNSESMRPSYWWGGEPLWITAEKQGKVTACLFWVGSDVEIGGKRPTHWLEWNPSITYEERVDTVLAWLDLPADQRPSFVTLYLSNVDRAGHDHTPGGPETIEAVEVADQYIGRLVRGLEERELFEHVNLVIVSDHGMTPVSLERVIYLDDYAPADAFRAVSQTSTAAIWPREGRQDEVYASLSTAHPNMTLYERDEIPERFHYRDNERIPPILAVADEGWLLFTRELSDRVPSVATGGAHGYDNELASMRAIFLAHGPAFKQGVVVEPFSNIHVYELLAAVLGVEPAPNDGSLEPVAHFLVE